MIAEARQAHADLPDEMYEILKNKAIVNSEPLSRRKLLSVSKAIRKKQGPEQDTLQNQDADTNKKKVEKSDSFNPRSDGELDENTPTDQAIQDDSTNIQDEEDDFVMLQNDMLRSRVRELEMENKLLKEKLAMSQWDDAMEKLHKQIATLKSQLDNRIDEVGRLKGHIKVLKREAGNG